MNGYKEYPKKRDKLIQDHKWFNEIIDKGCYCIICGYNDNPLILERHHIAGKNNDNITVCVCPTCHRILSNNQKSWDKKWIKNDNSPKMKLAFMLRGCSDISKLMSEQYKELSNQILEGVNFEL